MKPSKLYEALHALIGERVPLHIWGACGVGKPPMTPRARTATNRSSRNDVLGMPTAIPENTTTQVLAVPAKPARGVVLEFATKMRQSRGREVALNA